MFKSVHAGMRAVDLACLMLAPGAAGVLMTYTGITTSILVISAWNLIAWLPECYLLVCAQHAFPTLRYGPHVIHLCDNHLYVGREMY